MARFQHRAEISGHGGKIQIVYDMFDSYSSFQNNVVVHNQNITCVEKRNIKFDLLCPIKQIVCNTSEVK